VGAYAENAGTLGQGVELARVGNLWRVTRPLHPALRPLVCDYAGYWEAAAVAYRVRLVPMPRAVVMISLGKPFSDFRRLGTQAPGSGVIGSLVGGLSNRPQACEHPGGKEMIRLDLTPLGAYRLLATPMGELTNQVVELRDVLGPEAGELVERLAATRAWAARFDLLDALLLARLGRGPDPAPEVGHAWRLLSSTAGAMPVARVAAEVGWSHGHLVRRFSEQVGLTPKMATRVLRFDRALRMLPHGETSLTEIAAACGFYDQAHLNREFRALAGIPPGLMMASCQEEGDFAL
jgi:AraC-like DNA-binding protein